MGVVSTGVGLPSVPEKLVLDGPKEEHIGDVSLSEAAVLRRSSQQERKDKIY